MPARTPSHFSKRVDIRLIPKSAQVLPFANDRFRVGWIGGLPL